MEPQSEQVRGHFMKRTSDGELVGFDSVRDAVLFAVKIQCGMARRNEDLPAVRCIDFRVGVDIGDVRFADDDFHGTGVITPTRLQCLAEAGGIYVSGAVYNRLKTIVDVGLEAPGERRLKNLEEPVDPYRVITDGQAGTTAEPDRGSAVKGRWRRVAAAAVVLFALSADGIGFDGACAEHRVGAVELTSLAEIHERMGRG